MTRMKNLSVIVLTSFVFIILLGFQNCGGDDKEEPKQVTINILKSKTWTVSSVAVPVNTATESSDWVDFTVSFSDTNMTTAGHPTGAQVVWPSGTYSVSDDGKTITRGDGTVMQLNPVTETNFTAIFSMPPGTVIGARIAALDGEYRFNMK